MVIATSTLTMTTAQPMVLSLSTEPHNNEKLQVAKSQDVIIQEQKVQDQKTKDAHITTLNGVAMLATLFGLCVESFGIIHPSLQFDANQNLALTRLGVEQARLLIIGSAVGVVSPPSTIATKYVPTTAAMANPDPTAAVIFDKRDKRLDLNGGLMRQTFEAVLKDILDKLKMKRVGDNVAHYGLKAYKQKNPDVPIPDQSALYMNRLDSFREKYSLLQDMREDLVDGIKKFPRTVDATSMLLHWTIKDAQKFSTIFVQEVRDDIDRLEALVGCQEYMDASVHNDISTFAYHPQPSLTLMRYDVMKLREIDIVCKEAYPQYHPSAKKAIGFVERDLASMQAELGEDPEKATPRSIKIISSNRSRTSSPSGSRTDSPSRSGRRSSRLFHKRDDSTAPSRASSRAPSVAASRASSRASSRGGSSQRSESPERKSRKTSKILGLFSLKKKKKSSKEESAAESHKRSKSLQGNRDSLSADSNTDFYQARSRSMDVRRGRRFSTDTRASSTFGGAGSISSTTDLQQQNSPVRVLTNQTSASASSSKYVPSIQIQFDDSSVAQNKERSSKREDSPQSQADEWAPGSPDPETEHAVTDTDDDEDEGMHKNWDPSRRLSMHPMRVADTGDEYRTEEYLKSQGIEIRNFT